MIRQLTQKFERIVKSMLGPIDAFLEFHPKMTGGLRNVRPAPEKPENS
jgi:hypothetical protein